jgi:hypothetical protein
MNTLKNKAENIYLKDLKIIENQIGSGMTYGGQLEKLGKQLFGNKFKGVYAADEVKDLKRIDNGYFIFNTDNKDEEGQHWLGVVKEKKGGIMVYDSFGRPTENIAPNIFTLGHDITDTEYDAEQNPYTEENCGARSLAFLKVYNDHGSEVASMI